MRKRKNKVLRGVALANYETSIYAHFSDAWLFVHELQPPSEFVEFPVTTPLPQANETGQSQTNRTLWKTTESYG